MMIFSKWKWNFFFCKLEIRKIYLGKSTNLLDKIYRERKRAKLQLMSINETIVVSKNENCWKNEGENYFSPIFVFDSKTRSQFRPACTKSERNL